MSISFIFLHSVILPYELNIFYTYPWGRFASILVLLRHLFLFNAVQSRENRQDPCVFKSCNLERLRNS